MVRVVLDTVVFLRALLNPRNRSGKFLFEYAGRYRIIFSKETLVELLEVIRRPELTRKYKRLAGIDMRRVLDLLAQTEIVELREIPAIVRDPSDDIFVATAHAGHADYIVSEDKDLLSLGESTGIPVINTAAFIHALENL